MQREEQQLIEGLFSRLKQAESQTVARDAAAEQLINQHLQAQPGAPYYMAQAILIQEAALKNSMRKYRRWKARWLSNSSSNLHRAAAAFCPGCLAAVRVSSRLCSSNSNRHRGTVRHSNRLSRNMRLHKRLHHAAPVSSAAHCRLLWVWRAVW